MRNIAPFLRFYHFIVTHNNTSKRGAAVIVIVIEATKREPHHQKEKEEDEKLLNKCSILRCNIMSIKIPYMRKETPTLLTLSAAAIALVLSSPMLFFNVLLQPVQAQTAMNFKTPQPASGLVECSHIEATLTLDAQGPPPSSISSNLQRGNITGGTFQVNSTTGGEVLYSGNINSGRFSSSSEGGGLFLNATVNDASEVNDDSTCASTDDSLIISTPCSKSNTNPISLGILGQDLDGFGTFTGAVECPPTGGGNTTSSSMTGTTTQDNDGDGIPDSSDRCTHNSNPRCFKEVDTTTTTTTNTHE